MLGFQDWFPFDLSVDTLLIFLFTMFLVLAGTLAGIIIKELEVYIPGKTPTGSFKLWTDENRMFVLLSIVVGIGFWAAKVGFIECFIYATMLKAALGTVLNIVFKKRAIVLAVALAQAAVAKADEKLSTDKTQALNEALVEVATERANHKEPVLTELEKARARLAELERTKGG